MSGINFPIRFQIRSKPRFELIDVAFNYSIDFLAVPILDKEAYIVSMDYSPLLAGFSIVLADGRAAFLTSSNLKFDPNVSLFLDLHCQHLLIDIFT